MAEMVDLPTPDGVTWRDWEQAVRQGSRDGHYSEEVLSHALPRIREHWAAIFEPITLELPKRSVPGDLSKSQAVAIQALLNDSANLIVSRLQQERVASLRRLLRVELQLSQCQIRSSSGA